MSEVMALDCQFSIFEQAVVPELCESLLRGTTCDERPG